MSWTDDRVELLSRLWLEGRSASQIAAELGLNVTRNAVIGKVHRLGLAGRAKTASPAAPAIAKLKAKVAPRMEQPEAETLAEPLVLEPAAALPETSATEGSSADVVIPFSERVTIMDLRESSCRWPMGDPTNAEFRFCGARTSVNSGPYCAAHSRLAFQPTQERRRDRNERYARIA